MTDGKSGSSFPPQRPPHETKKKQPFQFAPKAPKVSQQRTSDLPLKVEITKCKEHAESLATARAVISACVYEVIHGGLTARRHWILGTVEVFIDFLDDKLHIDLYAYDLPNTATYKRRKVVMSDKFSMTYDECLAALPQEAEKVTRGKVSLPSATKSAAPKPPAPAPQRPPAQRRSLGLAELAKKNTSSSIRKMQADSPDYWESDPPRRPSVRSQPHATALAIDPVAALMRPILLMRMQLATLYAALSAAVAASTEAVAASLFLSEPHAPAFPRGIPQLAPRGASIDIAWARLRPLTAPTAPRSPPRWPVLALPPQPLLQLEVCAVPACSALKQHISRASVLGRPLAQMVLRLALRR
jgi:hypothetical protein